jgi:hypothetical protein
MWTRRLKRQLGGWWYATARELVDEVRGDRMSI